MFSNNPSGSLPHPAQFHASSYDNKPFGQSGNPFDYDDDEQQQSAYNFSSIYEKQMAEATSQQSIQRLLTRDEARLAELRLLKEQAKDDAEATQQLEKDINDLNQIMEDLAKLVHEQHDMVDSIEEHVEKSLQQVQGADRDLRRAVASNSAKYPVAAAAVGGVALGGPVGVAAGSAIAGIAAAVGGVFAGLYGGRWMKRQAQKQTIQAASSQLMPGS